MLEFDGSNYITTINTFVPPTYLTLTMWFCQTSSSGVQYLIGNDSYWAIYTYLGNLVCYLGGGAGTFIKTLSTDTWYHLVFYFDSAYDWVEVLIDGVVEFWESGHTVSPVTDYLKIGWGTDGLNPRKLIGKLDDVRIYSRILPWAEARAIYYTRGKDFIISDLQHWWPLQEYSNSTICTGAGTVKDIIGGLNCTPTDNPVYGMPISEIGRYPL